MNSTHDGATRIIPTLTDVVDSENLTKESADAALAATAPALQVPCDASEREVTYSAAQEIEPQTSSAQSMPLVQLPTPALEVGAAAVGSADMESLRVLPNACSDALAEQMMHRVVQRMNALLTQRVGEVIASVVEAQTRTLLPRIRQELECAIRQTVDQAIADELSEMDSQTNTSV